MAIGICIGEVTGGLHKSNFKGRVGMKAVTAGSIEDGRRIMEEKSRQVFQGQ